MSNSNGPEPSFPDPVFRGEGGSTFEVWCFIGFFVAMFTLIFTMIGMSYFDDGYDKTIGIDVTSVSTEDGETTVNADVIGLHGREVISFGERTFTTDVMVEKGERYTVEVEHWNAGPGAGYDNGVITEVLRESDSFVFDLR